MSRQNYATNSKQRQCFEKGKQFTSHSDTMLEPIQTTCSPLITSICSTPKMQWNRYWYHYCNDLLEIVDIHPLFSRKCHFEVFLVPKVKKILSDVHLMDWKVLTLTFLLSKIESMHPKGCINWNVEIRIFTSRCHSCAMGSHRKQCKIGLIHSSAQSSTPFND